MQPRGPLMTEHRLIERMISLMDKEIKKIEKENSVDQQFVDATIDFISFYADLTHHGKEEEILFRDLAKKKLTDIDRDIMNELIKEHAFGRTVTGQLVALADSYRNGDRTVLPSIIRTLRTYIDFYPNHIDKEDKHFFPSSMTYFSEQEQKSMLEEFREFDEKMIHEKYLSVIESIENKESPK